MDYENIVLHASVCKCACKDESNSNKSAYYIKQESHQANKEAIASFVSALCEKGSVVSTTVLKR